MIIDLRRDSPLAACGAHIFSVHGFAYKLFTKSWKGEDTIRRTFSSQCRAYEIASADPYLRNHVAEFFGPMTIGDVISAAEDSISKDYLLDCCYKLELLNGSDLKLTTNGLRANNPHLEEAQRRFHKLSINVLDASVFHATDPSRFKFIDFEMR